ncbi:MAG TPA: 50S ribosomal protein L6 [Armatimonadota bacterium]|nr:50S ribosomal protein L6 [Armatimonadota bacterium]
MSRIGKMPVPLPKGVTVQVEPGRIAVSGPKGKLERSLPDRIAVEQVDDTLVCTRSSDGRLDRSLHGLTRALVANMVTGVTEGFTKQLILHGVGYRATAEGRRLNLLLGFSHPVDVAVPEGLEVTAQAEGGNVHRLTIQGIDKELVGQFAADLRKLRPVEPYNAKGFRYSTEVVRRKAGKAAVGGGGPGR